MFFFRGLLDFFIPRERTLLYTTFDQAQYFKVKHILMAEGIPHRSRIDGGMRDLQRRTGWGGKAQLKHDLYVRKEDEQRALHTIR